MKRITRRPPPVVAVTLVINAVVFLAWQGSRTSQAGLATMAENFLTSWLHLSEGLWWTTITAAYSHNELWHLLINMMVLYSFGIVLERAWGTGRFVAFYLGAAVVSSLAHASVSRLLLGEPDQFALGASGALAGLVMAFALSYPEQRLLFFGIVPIPAMVAALAFVGLDVWGLVAQTRGGGLPIGHGAHLGGSLTGLLFFFLYLRPRPHIRGRLAPARPPVEASELSPEEGAELERLRRKIALDGIESLTDDERRLLAQIRSRWS